MHYNCTYQALGEDARWLVMILTKFLRTESMCSPIKSYREQYPGRAVTEDQRPLKDTPYNGLYGAVPPEKSTLTAKNGALRGWTSGQSLRV